MPFEIISADCSKLSAPVSGCLRAGCTQYPESRLKFGRVLAQALWSDALGTHPRAWAAIPDCLRSALLNSSASLPSLYPGGEAPGTGFQEENGTVSRAGIPHRDMGSI